MTNEPVTLMASVPSGKVSPKRDATSPESQKRPTLPSAPPIATHRYASIKISLNATSIGRSHQRWTSGGFPAGAERQTPLPEKFILQPAQFGNCKANLKLRESVQNVMM